MRLGGWPYRVEGSDWFALAAEYQSAPAAVQTVADVVRSIAESPAHLQLAYSTSMWDLIVTTAPCGSPPVDVIAVRGPMGIRDLPAGRVLIEHMPLVGSADVIERDATEAVPLFWRFLKEKYGIAVDA